MIFRGLKITSTLTTYSKGSVFHTGIFSTKSVKIRIEISPQHFPEVVTALLFFFFLQD